MSHLFDDLKEGFEEAIAHARGEKKLRARMVEVPKPPAHYKPKDIKRIRHNGNYSQSIFAKILNVSPKTIQAWESGIRSPTHAALRLLEIVDKGIYRPKLYRRAS